MKNNCGFKKTAQMLLLCLALIMALAALSSCAGAGDFRYRGLPGNYEIWRSSADKIDIEYSDNEYTGTPVVESYVCRVAWDGDYIYAQRKPDKRSDDSEISYFIIEVASETVNGPFTKDEFLSFLTGRDIVWNDQYWLNVDNLRPAYPEE